MGKRRGGTLLYEIIIENPPFGLHEEYLTIGAIPTANLRRTTSLNHEYDKMQRLNSRELYYDDIDTAFSDEDEALESTDLITWMECGMDD